jgi:peptidoglycan/xylan/chitin deacetylase (PgdA/CDA1 family)
MFFAKTPAFLPFFMPGFTWRMPPRDKSLYLTFDDGPIPELTPWVLETLERHNARATFFCVGDNVRKHPAVFQQVQQAGHALGNHTFNHLNGWKTDMDAYLENVALCRQVVDSKLFRPPYGLITRAQRKILARQYQIVMWDVLSGDFSQTLSPEQCLANVLRHARPGSIIVLHDSLKAERNLRFVLPRVLEHFGREGYRFEALKT